MTVLIFDLETQTKLEYKRKATPFCPDNYIVAMGWKEVGDPIASYKYFEGPHDAEMPIHAGITCLVGHNIKFDLLWIWKHHNLRQFIERGGRIWCTQYAEYLLRAHQDKYHMNSMDEIAPSYGGRVKIDLVKQMWEQGYNTSEIPKDLLIDYLVGTEEEGRNSGDIGNTELIYLGQRKLAEELGMTKIIEMRMDGLLATTEMEFNGLFIDVPEARRRTLELTKELQEVEAKLQTFVPKVEDPAFTFNWKSVYHKSALMFGGTLKYEKQAPYIDPKTNDWARKQEEETHYITASGSTVLPVQTVLSEGVLRSTLDGSEIVLNKSGKLKGEPKTKKVKVPGELKVKYQDFYVQFPGYVQPKPEWQGAQKDAAGNPIYATNSDVLDELAGSDVPFVQEYRKHADISKELGTYYMTVDEKGQAKGMLTCVRRDTHIVNHSLNHTSTVTSRLSSSNPNLQNIPRGDHSQVKKMFKSRFGADGVMVEADYSQLEVVVQGVLSKDPQLCEDLRNRIDFHCKRVSAKEGCTYEEALRWCKNEEDPNYAEWKPKRTAAKNFSFQRAYGAGAAAISASTGIPLQDVQDLIIAEEKMYPGVIRFNELVEKAVQASAKSFFDPARHGTYRRGWWVAPTGTRYSWRSWDAPSFLQARGVNDSFSPPELKNYPVQGTGGEMVQVILGILFREFVKRGWWSGRNGKALLVNTVHDCYWADTVQELVHEVGALIKATMETIPEVYNREFDMGITVPFPCEVEYGQNMYELKHLH